VGMTLTPPPFLARSLRNENLIYSISFKVYNITKLKINGNEYDKYKKNTFFIYSYNYSYDFFFDNRYS
jgi:hypothetical protein